MPFGLGPALLVPYRDQSVSQCPSVINPSLSIEKEISYPFGQVWLKLNFLKSAHG